MSKVMAKIALSETESPKTREAVEGYLGEPIEDGQILASNKDGTRFWIQPEPPSVIDGGIVEED